MVERLKIVEDREVKYRKENVVSATRWSVGIFCDHCLEFWAGTAPCNSCGNFSKPVALTYRQVMTGSMWTPWNLEKHFEFGDDFEARIAPRRKPRVTRNDEGSMAATAMA